MSGHNTPMSYHNVYGSLMSDTFNLIRLYNFSLILIQIYGLVTSQFRGRPFISRHARRRWDSSDPYCMKFEYRMKT